MAQPFNAETLQLAASASASGTLVYANNIMRVNQLTWLDRSGKELGKAGSVQRQQHVGLSLEGKIAATVRIGQIAADTSNYSTWLLDMQRGAETRFTLPSLPGSAPVWSPDGTLIAFGSGQGLYLKEASGGGEELVSESDSWY